MTRLVYVAVDESTLSKSAHGSITGEITLVGDGWIYPEQGWSDFPVVILSWWLKGCQYVGSRVGSSLAFGFMDGSFSFRVTSLSEKEWRIECAPSGVKEANLQVVSAEEFQKQLRVVAASVVEFCSGKGWESRDLETLRLYTNA